MTLYFLLLIVGEGGNSRGWTVSAGLPFRGPVPAETLRASVRRAFTRDNLRDGMLLLRYALPAERGHERREP